MAYHVLTATPANPAILIDDHADHAHAWIDCWLNTNNAPVTPWSSTRTDPDNCHNGHRGQRCGMASCDAIIVRTE